MFPTLSVIRQSLPLTAPFRISRGVKVAADVVVVELRQGDRRGRGEAVPYARYGETVDSVIEQINEVSDAISSGLSQSQLQEALAPGAARNAIDCAYWDLAAQQIGQPVHDQLGLGPLPALVSALTVSLDSVEAMHAAALKLRNAPLLKVKVDAEDPETQLLAVRAAAPDARLIVDPNESWTFDILKAMQPILVEARVDLVEQPLPADEDAVLEGFVPLRPICADESCHVAEDLPRLLNRYQAINIKLDKAGGLMGALQLLWNAQSAGMLIMSGCMISSSLGIAPAFHIARHASYVDLDGPLWLEQDYKGGAYLRDGQLVAPEGYVWGGG